MNPTLDTLDLVKSALGAPDDRIAKTINTGSGLVAYDLQAPAKNLYPVVTPILIPFFCILWTTSAVPGKSSW